jgi:hypothetical protein
VASLNQADQDLLNLVKGRFDFADNRVHRKFRARCDEQYSLYCNYDTLRAGLSNGNMSASDRERVLGDGQNMFGASMFIPFIYSTIETILPRMAANAPVPRLDPAKPGLEDNALNMQALIGQQMTVMKYSLSVQDTGKHGLLHGIGVRKDSWVKNVKETRKLVKMESGLNSDESWGSVPFNKTIYDDPYSADVDPRDWIWDPFGSSAQTIEWAIHRTWRSDDYCKGKLASGEWAIPEGVNSDEILRQHKDDEYTQVHQGKATAIGLDSPSPLQGKIHEVWEYHNGDRIIVVLDRAFPVADRQNPHWHGEIPFSVFRPVSLPGEMVGRSVVDALEDLNLELNTLRAQRRDNASQALETPMAYRVGKVDPTMIRWGRGFAIPVDGDPDAALKQLRINDVPASSYQEENGLKDDIQRTAGVLDIAGGSSVTETATGAQLVYSEANERIKNMVKRLEEETIVDDINFFVQMNQQHKRSFAIRVPQPAPPPLPGAPDRRWSWLTGDAGDLSGDFLPTVEPGSTAADNTPQMRNDAQIWAQLFGNPFIDKRKATEKMLQLLGVNQPNSYLVNEQQIPASVPEEMASQLERQGMDPAQVSQARDAAMQPHDEALNQSQQLQPAVG